MITELNKIPQQVVPGHKIDVSEYKVRNYRLHSPLESLSRLTLFICECDSNNTVTKVTPRNARQIICQWELVKDEFQFALDHNDTPTGSYEFAYQILLLHQSQIQKIRNVKMKRVVAELFNLSQVILSLDSSKTQQFVDLDDAAVVREAFNVVDDVIARWLGDGTFGDLGIKAPAMECLGEVIPDVDGDYAQIIEPSPLMPEPMLPDVPDIEQPKPESRIGK